MNDHGVSDKHLFEAWTVILCICGCGVIAIVSLVLQALGLI